MAVTSVEAETHALLEQERKDAKPNAPQVQVFRDYVAGKQPLTLTEEQKAIVKGVLRQTFCDNVCRRIVSTVAARVRVDRFDCSEEPVSRYVSQTFTLNWFRQLSARVHFTAVRDGDTFVSLAWDNIRKRVVFKRELAWNGKRGVFMAYDEFGQPAYAVREWDAKMRDPEDGNKIKTVKRRVVWFPNKIGRFVERGNGWQWFTLPEKVNDAGEVIQEAEEPGWIPWTEDGTLTGVPLGIPCIHFARMEQPQDASNETSGAQDNYGVSILDGGVLGTQDIINDDHWAIVAANRFTAYQQAWAKGIKLIDSNGKDVELVMMPGTIIHVEDKDAEFGVFSAGSMSELKTTLEIHHTAAARSTNTPVHTITGQWPSGEALIQADRPLIDQCVTLADSFGPAWASLMHRATQIANRFGKLQLNTEAAITTVFKSPERGDLLTLATIVSAISQWISNKEALRMLGYTDEKIEQIMKEKAEEAQFTLGALPGADTPGTPGATPPGSKPNVTGYAGGSVSDD